MDRVSEERLDSDGWMTAAVVSESIVLGILACDTVIRKGIDNFTNCQKEDNKVSLLSPNPSCLLSSLPSLMLDRQFVLITSLFNILQ